MTEQPHILAVEDEDISLQFLVYHLEKAGFRVTAVSSGADTKALLENEHVDMILLDLGLPDGDGLSLAREIRAHSDVPIIVLTARQGADDKLLALGLGADDYLTKPCDPRELILRIRNVMVRGNIPCAPEPVPAHEMPTLPPSPPPIPPAEPPRRKGRGLMFFLALAVGLIVGAGGAGWWYMNQAELKLAEDAADTDDAEDAASPQSDQASGAQAPIVQHAAPPANPPQEATPPDAAPATETEPRDAAERALEVTVTAQPPAAAPAQTGGAAPAPQAPSSTAPARDGYALAARSYAWVLKTKCQALPQGEHWQITKHTDLVRQVNRQYSGDWQPYIRTWVDRLSKLQEIYGRNSGVKLGNGEVMAGEKLKKYIEETQLRLNVTLCLSREAADYAYRKSTAQPR